MKKPLLCDDYGIREGCEMLANPENSIILKEEHPYVPGEKESHLCNFCNKVNESFFEVLESSLEENEEITDKLMEILGPIESQENKVWNF